MLPTTWMLTKASVVVFWPFGDQFAGFEVSYVGTVARRVMNSEAFGRPEASTHAVLTSTVNAFGSGNVLECADAKEVIFPRSDALTGNWVNAGLNTPSLLPVRKYA